MKEERKDTLKDWLIAGIIVFIGVPVLVFIIGWLLISSGAGLSP